mgnify:CR=1 FL=1
MNFFFSRNVGTSSTKTADDPSKAVTARKIKQLLHEIIEDETRKSLIVTVSLEKNWQKREFPFPGVLLQNTEKKKEYLMPAAGKNTRKAPF